MGDVNLGFPLKYDQISLVPAIQKGLQDIDDEITSSVRLLLKWRAYDCQTLERGIMKDKLNVFFL